MVTDAAPMLRTAGDPFAQVLALDEHGNRRLSASVVIAVALYAVLIVNATVFHSELHAFAEAVHRAAMRAKPYELQIEEPPPPPPPEPVAEEPKPPEPALAPPPPKANTPAPPTEAPPPAAAEAGKVLAQEPDPDEPVDLTGNTFIQGTGDSYAGGVTSSTGSSKTAVRDVRAAGSATAGTGAGSPNAVAGGTGPDLSAAARPMSGSWDHCGFPAEADIEQVNHATVSIAATISADGRAQTVSVVKDPGYGFGALAKRCALRERFSPAKNRAGLAVTTTQMITINFVRH